MDSNSFCKKNEQNSKTNVNFRFDLSKIDKTDLLLFLQFYLKKSHRYLIRVFSQIFEDSETHNIALSLNFWLNFALNFKDDSFVDLFLLKNEDKVDFIIDELRSILKLICQFLYDNLNSQEEFNKMMKNKYDKLYELLMKFEILFDNLYNSNLKNIFFDDNIDTNINNNTINNNSNYIIINNLIIYNDNINKGAEEKEEKDNNKIIELFTDKNDTKKVENEEKNNETTYFDYSKICQLFENFKIFSGMEFNLIFLQILFFEKIGYSFVDYKGNFLWADEYSKYVLFEEKNIEKINLFDLMTDFSKFIMFKKNIEFFDFRKEDNKFRIFTYTIDGNKNENNNGNDLIEKLSKIKTLVSRASPVMIKDKEDSLCSCILLESKFSVVRQNYDFFYWKNDYN